MDPDEEGAQVTLAIVEILKRALLKATRGERGSILVAEDLFERDTVRGGASKRINLRHEVVRTVELAGREIMEKKKKERKRRLLTI